MTGSCSQLNGEKHLATDNLFIWQEEVVELILDGDQVIGVETSYGTKMYCDVLTNGTFKQLMHVGFNRKVGGKVVMLHQ